jgi:hypothetical protein
MVGPRHRGGASTAVLRTQQIYRRDKGIACIRDAKQAAKGSIAADREVALEPKAAFWAAQPKVSTQLTGPLLGVH